MWIKNVPFDCFFVGETTGASDVEEEGTEVTCYWCWCLCLCRRIGGGGGGREEVGVDRREEGFVLGVGGELSSVLERGECRGT